MAILKYTDAEGNVHSINSYKINNVIVTQEKGESTVDVMSQKAVTDEIKKVNSLIPTKVSQLTNDENYLTQHQSLADYAKTADVNASLALKANTTDVTTELNKKANSSDVYTTSQVDEKLNVKANVVDVYTKEQCNDNFMKIWQGSQSEYDAITSRDNNTLYVIE